MHVLTIPRLCPEIKSEPLWQAHGRECQVPNARRACRSYGFAAIAVSHIWSTYSVLHAGDRTGGATVVLWTNMCAYYYPHLEIGIAPNVARLLRVLTSLSLSRPMPRFQEILC